MTANPKETKEPQPNQVLASTRHDAPSAFNFGKMEILGVLGSVASMISLVLPNLFPDLPRWLLQALGGTFMLVAFCCFWRHLARLAKALHAGLAKATPWVVLVSLILTGCILLTVWHSRVTTSIVLRDAPGAIFNSFDHAPSHTHFLLAFGESKKSMEWRLDPAKSMASFSYEANNSIRPSGPESCGGYFIFYETPCDKLRYHTISFQCQATDFTGRPDVGVRVVVDDPRAVGDRELVAYDYPSLFVDHPINPTWTEFKLHLSDFHQTTMRPPFPNGLDANQLNKVVFFINTTIASNCPSATLSFRDVAFRK
jgi:hypothetical protein